MIHRAAATAPRAARAANAVAAILWTNGCAEFRKSVVAKRKPTTLHPRRVGVPARRAVVLAAVPYRIC